MLLSTEQALPRSLKLNLGQSVAHCSNLISPAGWLRHRVETGLAADSVGEQVPRTTLAPPTWHLAGPEQIRSELKLNMFSSVECSPACLQCHRLYCWFVGPFTHAGHFTPASSQSVHCLREPQCSALPPCIFDYGERPAHCTPAWNAPLWFSPLGWSLQPDGTSLNDALEVVLFLLTVRKSKYYHLPFV